MGKWAQSALQAGEEWAAGREWAVQSFVALSGLALLSVVLGQRLKGAAATDTKASAATKREFRSFQRSYLAVYIVVMLADWLQGTHMYTLYTKYQQDNAAVRVGTLFFTGFVAAGLLGTFTGPLVDRYGRKRACLVYVALELLINSLEHFNHMSLLLVGRVLGGVSTSLLFSAFEAWMVTEHRRRGFPEAWIGLTFGRSAVCNGAAAIVAGFAAQLTADILGDIGPFQLAMSLTAVAGVLMLQWEENYGSVAAAPKAAKQEKEKAQHGSAASGRVLGGWHAVRGSVSGLLGAWHAVRQSEELMMVGLCYSLFEGAMYVFVFNWVPTLATALGGFGAFAPVQGLLFACLMAAISIGGELYSYAFGAAPIEAIGVAIYAAASVCMGLLVVCSCSDCGSFAFLVQFGACLGFEVCCGAFTPCIATHRSKYVPDEQQSTINNLFRLPLNMLVAAGTMLSDHLPPHKIFAVCAAAHALATLCQLRLAWLGSQRNGGGEQSQKKSQ